MKGHIPTILKYDWVLGPRWRWDCSCGRGLGQFWDEESAKAGFQVHLRGREAWEAHLRSRAQTEKGTESR